jgi:hypothetical protein
MASTGQDDHKETWYEPLGQKQTLGTKGEDQGWTYKRRIMETQIFHHAKMYLIFENIL